MPNIPVLDLRPQLLSIKDEVMTAIESVVDSTAYINGPATQQFEDDAAKYIGVKHAIGLNSGTDALIIGLRSLGVKSGDEVITTPFSFFATAESISRIGATPVFVDIEEQSMNIDASLIEAAITEQTKAILPVHLFGRPADMTEIINIADKYNLVVIEDCAQSFGATTNGQRTGAIGDVGTFSFFPTKNLGAYGDGGLLTTNSDKVAHMAKMLRNHGGLNKYSNEVFGYNSRLDSLQAAILGVKLPHIDSWNNGRREVAARYKEMLEDVPGVVTPSAIDGHVFHQYTIRLTDSCRDDIVAAMGEAGVSCMIYYPSPQDKLPVYEGMFGEFPISNKLSEQVVSLPIWPELDPETQSRICGILAACLKKIS